MSLMATSLGVAGFWSSWNAAARDSKEFKHFLGWGEDDMCIGVYAVGRTDKADKYQGHREPLGDRVTWME